MLLRNNVYAIRTVMLMSRAQAHLQWRDTVGLDISNHLLWSWFLSCGQLHLQLWCWQSHLCWLGYFLVDLQTCAYFTDDLLHPYEVYWSRIWPLKAALLSYADVDVIYSFSRPSEAFQKAQSYSLVAQLSDKKVSSNANVGNEAVNLCQHSAPAKVPSALLEMGFCGCQWVCILWRRPSRGNIIRQASGSSLTWKA